MKKEKKHLLSNFQLEFRDQLKIAILTALGFIIAFAWRDFLVSLLNTIVTRLDVTDNLYLYQLFAAIVLTLLAVLIMVLLSASHQDKKPEKKK
ncbi:MAG: hypothetical protein KKF50_01690 [Nanoarchaeota archaeon]|nr:hypothetical protein [Nanoarchaeota archaeon]